MEIQRAIIYKVLQNKFDITIATLKEITQIADYLRLTNNEIDTKVAYISDKYKEDVMQKMREVLEIIVKVMEEDR